MNGSVLLVWFHPSVIPLASAWAGAALQVLIALSTVLLQVPAHQRLQRHGFSPQVHHKLILFKLAPHCGHFCACVAFALDCGPRCRSCRNFFLSVAPFPNPKRARRVETANSRLRIQEPRPVHRRASRFAQSQHPLRPAQNGQDDPNTIHSALPFGICVWTSTPRRSPAM